MKVNTLPILALVSVTLSVIVSCDRADHYLPGQQNLQCRIKKITFERTSTPYTGLFYYNKQNNPDSVIYQRVTTGLPNLHFYYDKQHKLTELKAVYSNNTYESWHFFTWQGQRIIADTIYTWGQTDTRPAPGNYHDKWVHLYEYDAKGRMVKMTYHYLEPYNYEGWGTTFTYDANGNLDRGQAVVYDNYRNPLSLHPFWQFLTHDYSVNNPYPATFYNQFRLPVQFDLPIQYPTRMYFLIGGRWLDDAKLDYEWVR